MPTYGYQCTECDHTFEVLQKMTDEPLKECEKCRGSVRRLIYPAGIVFKGSGFHVNDYKKPDAKPAPAAESTTSETPKVEPKPAESKA